jgi:hypothetical protein
MKIKGWDKITGYTYKGMCIVNPMTNSDETKYYATILNLNVPQKPKWELSVLTDKHRFKQDNSFHIVLRTENNISSTTIATKQMMKSVVQFRMIVENMIDEILKIELTSAPKGIINHVNQNGTTIQLHNSHSINIV